MIQSGDVTRNPLKWGSVLLAPALLLFPGFSKLHLENKKPKTPQKNNRKQPPKTPEVAAEEVSKKMLVFGAPAIFHYE